MLLLESQLLLLMEHRLRWGTQVCRFAGGLLGGQRWGLSLLGRPALLH